MKRTALILLTVIILSGCSLEEPAKDLTAATDLFAMPLAAYPPSETPYRIASSTVHGDFWLVHTREDALFSFAPVSPEYADYVSVDECRFAWVEANQRFTDPCSGDEWELDGRLNLEYSTELWSNRDLDQYAITVVDGLLYVHLSQKKLGALRVGAPPTR